MRGAHCGPDYRQHHTGIIPADAGSTDTFKKNIGNLEDHPRGCGEHDPQRQLAHNGRIIPADAGSTGFDSENHGLPEDHPRGCGEHWALSL